MIVTLVKYESDSGDPQYTIVAGTLSVHARLALAQNFDVDNDEFDSPTARIIDGELVTDEILFKEVEVKEGAAIEFFHMWFE